MKWSRLASENRRRSRQTQHLAGTQRCWQDWGLGSCLLSRDQLQAEILEKLHLVQVKGQAGCCLQIGGCLISIIFQPPSPVSHPCWIIWVTHTELCRWRPRGNAASDRPGDCPGEIFCTYGLCNTGKNKSVKESIHDGIDLVCFGEGAWHCEQCQDVLLLMWKRLVSSHSEDYCTLQIRQGLTQRESDLVNISVEKCFQQTLVFFSVVSSAKSYCQLFSSQTGVFSTSLLMLIHGHFPILSLWKGISLPWLSELAEAPMVLPEKTCKLLVVPKVSFFCCHES